MGGVHDRKALKDYQSIGSNDDRREKSSIQILEHSDYLVWAADSWHMVYVSCTDGWPFSLADYKAAQD